MNSVCNNPRRSCVHYGFTLIELLVVMSMVALLMSFVGPMTIQNLEKAEAKSELLTVKRWLKDLGFKSQMSSQQLTVRLEGKVAMVFDEQDNLIERQSFEHVFFQPVELSFNRLGMPSQFSLDAYYREQLISVLLTRQDNQSRSG